MQNIRKGAGIVCEYNPFHKGHAYQIALAKQMGAPFVVCAMSGDFTQRAEPAFQDKKIRAENAVRNGADIVLEIPFPFSSMSAEGFAGAGVSVLEDSGLCDTLVFGSECADTDKLLKVAKLADKDFHKQVLSLQKNEPNLSYALARQQLVQEKLGKEYANIIANPNDILGVEYLKALKTLTPVAIKRETPRGGFDKSFASSSYIRKNIFCDENEIARNAVPEDYCFDGIYAEDSSFFNHMLLSLVQKKPDELAQICEVPRGCEHSIVRAAMGADSYEELCRSLSSKTLTDAKIRRMLLFSFFGVSNKAAAQKPLYTEVLALSETGRKMLKKYSEDRKIIVASRIGQIKKDDDAMCQYNFARLAKEVLYKCRRIRNF